MHDSWLLSSFNPMFNGCHSMNQILCTTKLSVKIEGLDQVVKNSTMFSRYFASTYTGLFTAIIGTFNAFRKIDHYTTSNRIWSSRKDS